MNRNSQSGWRGIFPFVAAISLAGGPITWTAHTNCQTRLSEIDRANSQVQRGTHSPASDKHEKHSPDSGAAFVSACAAKPADSDTRAAGLVRVASDGVESLLHVCWAESLPKFSPPITGLHRQPFQSQAPPWLG